MQYNTVYSDFIGTGPVERVPINQYQNFHVGIKTFNVVNLICFNISSITMFSLDYVKT